MTQIFPSFIQKGQRHNCRLMRTFPNLFHLTTQPSHRNTALPGTRGFTSNFTTANLPKDIRRALDAVRPSSRHFGGPHYFRFQLLPQCSLTTTETVNFAVFWGITPCSLAERCSCFGVTCCLHLQDTLHLTARDNTLIRNAAVPSFLPSAAL